MIIKKPKEINSNAKQLTGLGTAIIIAASYISFMKLEIFHVHFLLVLFEPAGWFLLWAGLDLIVYFSKETKKAPGFLFKNDPNLKLNFLHIKNESCRSNFIE